MSHKYGLPVSAVEPSVRARARRWHWGIAPRQVVDWQDADYPRRMQEIGRLCELHVRPQGHRKDTIIPIPEKFWMDFPAGEHAQVNNPHRKQQAHVVFDNDHPLQRIYLCLPDEVLRQTKTLWNRNATMDLNDLAAQVGGRQGKRRDYPRLAVTPIGTLTHVVYYISKKGDENPTDPRSQYIHEMGEDGGLPPMLAVDSRGRFWYAGGSYTCPVPGIMR